MKALKKQLAFLLSVISVLCILPITASAKEESEQKQYIKLNAPIILEKGNEVEFKFGINDGYYEFSPVFRPISSTAQSVKYSVMTDGKIPFDGADNLTAQVWFVDDGKPGKLSTGDETAPTQRQSDEDMESFAYDKTGINGDFYRLKFNTGIHTVKIKCQDEPFKITALLLKRVKETEKYSDVEKNYNGTEKYNGAPIIVEGESPVLRNDYSLTAKADNSDIKVTPNDSKHSVINYIGGENWAKPYQEIVWETQVPKDGLYAVDFFFKQNSIINGCAFRSLKIDGEIPFAEAKTIAFPYKTAWQNMRLKDENGNEALLRLTKGKHRISLSVTLGTVAEVYKSLQGITEKVGSMYLDIVMITGETPDSNRDYELYKQIPDYETRLEDIYDELSSLSAVLKSRSDINGELDAAVRNMMRAVKKMHDERYKSHMYLDTYYSYYQTLCSWLFDIKDMSLSLDKIVLSTPGRKCEVKSGGFFKAVWFTLKRFAVSFTGDYTVNSINGKNDGIKIWVNWGRDQVKVLNALIGRSFSAKTGINVRVEQVNASLIQGIVSNNSPDLYLQLSRTEPVNLAMRGVLEDLSKFDGFNEVLKNFMDGAELPYRYNGGCYALPDTQSFSVMFCRDDILKQLKIEIPQTWVDFLDATSVVQRKNMNSFLPYTRITSATTVNVGVGGLSIFPTLLLQNGQGLYNKEENATLLASPISVKAFTYWTQFYTKYTLNPDVNFYQRFRTGTIPLGISGYANYLTFSVAAPEIEGKWSVHPVPGTVRADGSTDHSVSGAGTGCAIMKSSKNKDKAWEFLKWWVSEDTQYSYSADIEAVLGPSGRIDTANVKALSRMSWEGNAFDSILAQWKNVKEIPEIPGSYYVSRSVDQAFWAVYNGEMTEKEAITEWSRISDTEIKRKLREYPKSGE